MSFDLNQVRIITWFIVSKGNQQFCPQTGNNGQPLLGMLAGTAILAVLVFSQEDWQVMECFWLSVRSLLLSPQVFCTENKELVSYNRQVPISSGVSRGWFSHWRLRWYAYRFWFAFLKGVANRPLLRKLSYQPAVSGIQKLDWMLEVKKANVELWKRKPDQDISESGQEASPWFLNSLTHLLKYYFQIRKHQKKKINKLNQFEKAAVARENQKSSTRWLNQPIPGPGWCWKVGDGGSSAEACASSIHREPVKCGTRSS